MKSFGLIIAAFSATSILALSACQRNETAIPLRKNIEDVVFASGYTEQENIYTVFSTADGIIRVLRIKEADQVKKNDLIAVLDHDVQNNQLEDAQVVYANAVHNSSPDSPQLQQIQTQIKQAQQQVEFDKENYLRYKELWGKKSVSKLDFEKTDLQYQASQSNLQALQKQYQDAQNALKLSEDRSRVQVSTQRALLNDYDLSAGVSGQVINVFKKQGELVRRGEAIARIGSGNFIIRLFVSEDDITKVNVGQPVGISINTYPDRTFQATVTKIFPGFDPVEQSYIVEARFDELPEKTFSGTQLQANIKTGNKKDALVIPTEFVLKGNFVLLESGEQKQIKTGRLNSEWTEVISGLSENDVILKSKK